MTENKVRQWTEADLPGLDNRIKTRIGTQTRIPVSLDSHIKNVLFRYPQAMICQPILF
jgi:hypothetical protein